MVVPFNASVTNNILEIRFYWAGKGTTRFPRRGVYGPLVSAIDVDPCKLSKYIIHDSSQNSRHLVIEWFAFVFLMLCRL